MGARCEMAVWFGDEMWDGTAATGAPGSRVSLFFSGLESERPRSRQERWDEGQMGRAETTSALFIVSFVRSFVSPDQKMGKRRGEREKSQSHSAQQTASMRSLSHLPLLPFPLRGSILRITKLHPLPSWGYQRPRPA